MRQRGFPKEHWGNVGHSVINPRRFCILYLPCEQGACGRATFAPRLRHVARSVRSPDEPLSSVPAQMSLFDALTELDRQIDTLKKTVGRAEIEVQKVLTKRRPA